MNENTPEPPAEQPQPGAPAEPVPAETVPDETDVKLVELEDRWLRAVADLDNLRKRIAREAERTRAEERDRVASEWLPVVDNLELALSHAPDAADPVLDGVRAVRDQAVAVLTGLGYPRHDETGVPFDPARHDAVMTVELADADPGTVVEVLRPGYGDGERQLRPATVAVAKKVE
ncbi:nucleotide exchange factor GrpE [Nonomuraea jiangxiensis]|uniref:Protein GrpE n=1 Tax=Nonomuraea jiangxiensis TaxID=633440 RepID=A0A1G9C7E1_9ACTN|nr:nucleotide exchange factor GrpE [Nonomuraea jiangxiensis]SDK47582.1 molecular chaperone GrpE [Nonomuraea jiangxiensis]